MIPKLLHCKHSIMLTATIINSIKFLFHLLVLNMFFKSKKVNFLDSQPQRDKKK